MLQGLAAATASRKGWESWRSPFLAGGGPFRWLGANLLVTALYGLLGYAVSRFFAAYGLFPAPIWLPSSVAVVAAMMGGLGLMPGVFAGSFIVNAALFHSPFLETTVISLGNALGPAAGAWATGWFRPPTGLFTRFSGVVAFIVCNVLLHPALTATSGTFALAMAQPLDLAARYSIWVTWWLSDSGGTLYLAPALLLWLGVERMSPRSRQRIDRRDLAIWASVAALALILFATPPFRGSDVRLAFPFLLVVPLSWIALRMSLRAAYTLVFLVSIIAAAATVAGEGPFQGQGLGNPLQLVGALVVLLATDVLTIVALVCERREAQEESRVKSMFLANMSHELRTPLNAIIGFSELMGSEPYGPLGDARYTQFSHHILNSGRHLLSLINDILDLTKLEAGRFELHEEDIPVARLIADCVGLVQVQADAKSIRLDSEVACGDLMIKADGKALHQILLNLLSNAVKFTPEGGGVAIAARVGDDGEFIIRVTDTGIGIPGDALERVFAPFEQANPSYSRKVEGTGLGLSITRGLVALHGGTITLESAAGTGTAATVILPARRVTAHVPSIRVA